MATNDARKTFLNQLPNLPLKSFIIKASLVAIIGIISMFSIIAIVDSFFKDTLIDSALNRFPEIAVYIPSIAIGFFIIYNSNFQKILKEMFPKVTLRSKRLFWGIFVLDLIITVIFGLI